MKCGGSRIWRCILGGRGEGAYGKGRPFRPRHEHFPSVDICFVGEGDFDAVRGVFGEVF